MDLDALARFYDFDYGHITEDIPMLLGFAQQCGGPVLELGVGTGRLALPLAEAGYEVTGVDISEPMLAIARPRLSAFGARVQLVQADFVDFDLDLRFALAYCGFNSFLHLIESHAQMAALRCWRRHLRGDGLLVIDVHNPDLARLAAADGSLELADHWVDAESGHAIYKLFASDLDFPDQVHTIHIFYDEVIADGSLRRTADHFPTRILFRRELELLLSQAGFGALRFYGDYDLSPWQSHSPRLIAAAQAQSP